MMSQRPYTSGRDTSAALAELRRCTGTQFDPAVVEVFCVVMADELAAAARRLVAEAVPG